MEKRYAFLFSLLLTLLIGVNFYFFSSINNEPKIEKVVIGKVIDGDTVVLTDGRTLRLLNVNSPEKDQPESKLATNYLTELYNRTVDVEITGIDKYKRSLARIYYDGQYVNLELVKRGLSSKFLVEKDELVGFASAEEQAITNGLGIWNKSNYYGCFTTDINKYEEEVIILSRCGAISMKGWKLKDESRKTYFFDLGLTNKLVIHSGVGKDNQTDIFMGFSDNVWNDDRDSLYLFDQKGGLALYEAYGY